MENQLRTVMLLPSELVVNGLDSRVVKSPGTIRNIGSLSGYKFVRVLNSQISQKTTKLCAVVDGLC